MLTATGDLRSDKGSSYLMVAYIHSKAAFSYIFVIKKLPSRALHQ